MKLPEPFGFAGEHVQIDLPGARAVFTTRRGGVSTGPYASLNLGRRTDDDPGAVGRNREAIAAELGVRTAYVRQVHGARVVRVDSAGGETQEADGLATSKPGLAPAVLVADCLPIAIAADGAGAMVHAGWRGLAAGVVAAGVRAVRELGAAGPLAAAIGPGAGPCCYEAGAEVHSAFARHGGAARRGRNADLKAVARLELEAAGFDTIHDIVLCTICADAGLFFSHRRDAGVTGRQAGIAWLSG